jgi:hypothetical protein
MRIPQLSLFIENKPGHLLLPSKLLTDAGVNIVTLSLADTKRFGILRLIVDDPQRAQEVLEGAGLPVAVTEVLAINVADRPGGLFDLLKIFDQAEIVIEYMYAFTCRLGNSAVLVFRFSDIDAAISALTRAGINPVTPINLYERVNVD